ncbi:MAG: hypothetical protein M1827_003862 [Pycnora praestabilis]|nr:MAG: hypothetical protein M1827_003862 [Pycnora praestabilis]
MPEDGSAVGRQQDDHKFLSRQHWRGKIFTNDETLAKEANQKFKLNDDVVDFLKPSTIRPPLSQNTVFPGPRLDISTASRWPTAAAVNPSSTPPTSHSRQSSQGRSPGPRRKRKGLIVTFSDAMPDIIGEGGDEADLPPRDILKLRDNSNLPTLSPGSQVLGPRSEIGTGSDIPNIQKPLKQDTVEQVNFRPTSIRRTPTGFAGTEGATELNEVKTTSDLAEYDSPIDDDDSGPGLLKSEPIDSRPGADGTQFKMRAEEGRALYQALQHIPPPQRQDLLRPSSFDMPSFPPASPLSTPIVDGEPIQSYSLRPTPSPQPHSQSYFPSSISPEANQPQQQSSAISIDQDPGLYAITSPQTSSKAFPFTLRSAATAVADDALDDFSERVRHLNTLFHLSAESIRPLFEAPFSELIRAGIWWFLKGRGELEAAIRSGPRSGMDEKVPPYQKKQPTQAYVDLAKAWWIIKEVAVHHPEPQRYGFNSLKAPVSTTRRGADSAIVDAIEIRQSIISNLRALTMSMKRNNLLPPQQDEAPLPQGLDTTIWLRYPTFTPAVSSLLSGSSSSSLVIQNQTPMSALSDSLPLGDTKRHFSYGRMFVDVLLSTKDDASQEFRLPCLLSIVRERADWQMKVFICSQNGLVNICVQSSKKFGPTWDDVRWKTGDYKMQLHLTQGFLMVIQFTEKDYKTLWGIYDYTHTVEQSLQPQLGENLVFESTVKSFQSITLGSFRGFPEGVIKRCRVRIFEYQSTHARGSGERRLHRGYRFIVVTSPKIKTLSSLSHDLGKRKPIEYGFLRGEDGAPAYSIRINENQRSSTLLLTFNEAAERTQLHSLLIGNAVTREQAVLGNVPLEGFSIHESSHPGSFSPSRQDVLKGLEWQQVQVISRDPDDPNQDFSQSMYSEHLRICTTCKAGTVTDRINLGPGELQLHLNVNNATELKVLRTVQEDMTISMAENQISKSMAIAFVELLTTVATSDTIRTYQFRSLKDLHVFQAAITGFSAIFDGTASTFAISRRRMVVPIYKKWEASLARLQIVRQEKVVQLVAFFYDFKNGDCMNFNLKSTDVFEAFSRSGKYYIRIVDAKFALPKGENSESRQFVCLDMPEYPGEHDDITIGFDTEIDRDRFQEALPAPVTKVSRMASLRK